jgi:hypothetical protein
MEREKKSLQREQGNARVLRPRFCSCPLKGGYNNVAAYARCDLVLDARDDVRVEYSEYTILPVDLCTKNGPRTFSFNRESFMRVRVCPPFMQLLSTRVT